MKILIIIIIPIIYTFQTRKSLKKHQNKITESWVKIDNLLKTRNDIIPDLLEILEKYNIKEETLDSINNVRSNLLTSKTKKDKMANSSKLTNELGHLFAITENYSELKINDIFLNLQSKIHETEDQINNSKRRYNNLALDYKNKLDMFPSKIIAYVFKLKPFEIFNEEVDLEEKIEVLEL